MKAWIGIFIKSDNPGFLNAIENLLPDKSDVKLWQAEGDINRSYDIDGVECISASLFYNDFNDRANFKATLKGINGFLHVAESGSYMKETNSYHDELLPNGCPMQLDILEYSEII